MNKKILSVQFLAVIFILSLVTSTPAEGASVLVPLQTCGISPAAGRSVILTPVQAQGVNMIPVMDKIQTNTDGSGNVWVSLLPGVYAADVRPSWGQVGTTEFYFYVDPSNAVQSAFTNLLTGTNNTWPPNQYAYSAQASDARYPALPVTSNDIASVNSGQIYPPALSPDSTSWMTNQISEWWSADMINSNDQATIATWTGRNGNSWHGNQTATYCAYGMYGYPALYLNGSLLTNTTLAINNGFTNTGTIFIVYRWPGAPSWSGGVLFAAGVNDPGINFASWDLRYNIPSENPYGTLQTDMTNGAFFQFPDRTLSDDVHVFCATWGPNYYEDFLDGKMMDNTTSQIGLGANPPIYFIGTLCLGSDYSKAAPVTAYVSEVLLSTNGWTLPSIDGASNFFLKKINRLRMPIVLASDSIGCGGTSTWDGDWKCYIASNFPNLTIDNLSYPGQNSGGLLKMSSYWLTTATYSVPKIAIWWFNLNNDGIGSGFLNTTTNNLLAWAQMAHSNGWLTVVVNPQSNQAVDTNNQRFVFQNWLTNSWQTNFNAIVDLARDPDFGQTNQFTNTMYFAGDGIHPTNAFYSEAVQCFFTPVINSLINGTYFCTSTTAPPPTVNQPWMAQDTRAPGRIFSNSNGVWITH